MPTYEYRCKSCGEQLEVVQSFTDDSLTDCPNCGGPLRKVFGSIGITFKGSGFYKTDSRAGSTSTASSKPSESKEPASSGGDGSSSSSDSSTKETKKEASATKSDAKATTASTS